MDCNSNYEQQMAEVATHVPAPSADNAYTNVDKRSCDSRKTRRVALAVGLIQPPSFGQCLCYVGMEMFIG